MPIQVARKGRNTVMVVGRVFSGREAGHLRSLLREVETGTTAEIDFTGTAEIHPVALAALVELAGEERVSLRTRGLGSVHRRLLEYLGSNLARPEET